MKYADGKDRCFWCNPENELYMKYHDEEWGILNLDDDYLFEMLVLESFQAGLSWETILNKRENFKKAFDDFDIDKISEYDDEKIDEQSFLRRENTHKTSELPRVHRTLPIWFYPCIFNACR